MVPPAVPSMNWNTFSTPAPLVALMSATGEPSWLASSAVSTWPPRLARSSAMLRITKVGSLRLRMGAASTR